MISVRELPPLRHSIEVQTPSGSAFRWAADEPGPENVPSGVRHSSTMPGGFENFDCTLPRNPARDYPDLERFSTIVVRHCGGEVVSETRLERAPRTSGDQMAVSPSGVGLQAHLEDNKSASMIYVDGDLTVWRQPSVQRRIDLINANYGLQDFAATADTDTGFPSLRTTLRGDWAATSRAVAEPIYDAGPGNRIASIYYAWKRSATISAADVQWSWLVGLTPTDNLSSFQTTANLRAVGPGVGQLDAATPTRYAYVQHRYDAAGGTANTLYELAWTALVVYGDHGLPGRGAGPQGFYASDIVGHAVNRWAPLLNTMAAGQSTISPSTFVIGQLAFRDPTTAAEIIKAATRFGLQDWAVWENKTFWWHERGARGRSWRARVGPAQLEETGPQADRVWESIIVQYRDVDGTTRTVGPPGAGVDAESADLKDTDPENPANKLGIIRRDLLTMGTSTAAGAIEIGRRFLEQTKLLDKSGRARLVGHVEDDRGVLHPFSHVRAGDTIVFVDAADPSPRRIVRADHDHDARACTVDLDAPPDGLQALLERLGVRLAPLGVN